MRHVAIAWFAATIVSCIPIAAKAADETPHGLALRVREIFSAKCVECHDEATARPRGDFGYVLDLPRVAANRDWIIPGDAEKSELYLMVRNDEMPGDEASVPPLTPDEKDTVREWIEAGAPANLASADKSSNPKVTDSPVTRRLTVGQRMIRALGRLHPPSSHFPIALLIAAFPAELMWKRTRKPSWKATVRFCVMLGAAGAVFTAILGWCNASFSNYTGASAELLEWHRWIGTVTAVWAVVISVISEIAHKEGHPRLWRYSFRLTLFIGIVLVSVSGYLGASLIYGLNHFAW